MIKTPITAENIKGFIMLGSVITVNDQYCIVDKCFWQIKGNEHDLGISVDCAIRDIPFCETIIMDHEIRKEKFEIYLIEDECDELENTKNINNTEKRNIFLEIGEICYYNIDYTPVHPVNNPYPLSHWKKGDELEIIDFRVKQGEMLPVFWNHQCESVSTLIEYIGGNPSYLRKNEIGFKKENLIPMQHVVELYNGNIYIYVGDCDGDGEKFVRDTGFIKLKSYDDNLELGGILKEYSIKRVYKINSLNGFDYIFNNKTEYWDSEFLHLIYSK